MESAYAVILRELWTPTPEMLQHLWLIVEARISCVTSHLTPWPPPDSKIRVLRLCFRYLLVCPSWQKVQDGVTVWWYDIKLNTAILTEKHLPLYDELASKVNVEYIAGGEPPITLSGLPNACFKFLEQQVTGNASGRTGVVLYVLLVVKGP